MDSTSYVRLTNGGFATVDAADFERVIEHAWFRVDRGRTSYAARDVRDDGTKVRIYMHREILGAGPGEETDHVNHNGLDNRRSNLRLCKHRQNIRNQRGFGGSSEYKGVHRDKRTGRWRAMICVDNRSRHLGRFDTEIEAAAAYDAAAREAFGEFAHLNLEASS